MTDKRPTPETDTVDGKPTWQENIIEKGWVPADFARRLERERDGLKEQLDTAMMLIRLQKRRAQQTNEQP